MGAEKKKQKKVAFTKLTMGDIHRHQCLVQSKLATENVQMADRFKKTFGGD